MAPSVCISISLSALFIHTTTQYQLTSHVHAFWVYNCWAARFFMTLCVLKIILWILPLCQIEIVFFYYWASVLRQFLSALLNLIHRGFNKNHNWQKNLLRVIKNKKKIKSDRRLLESPFASYFKRRDFLPSIGLCYRKKIRKKNCWASNWDGEKNERKLNEKRNKSNMIACKCCVTHRYMRLPDLMLSSRETAANDSIATVSPKNNLNLFFMFR